MSAWADELSFKPVKCLNLSCVTGWIWPCWRGGTVRPYRCSEEPITTLWSQSMKALLSSSRCQAQTYLPRRLNDACAFAMPGFSERVGVLVCRRRTSCVGSGPARGSWQGWSLCLCSTAAVGSLCTAQTAREEGQWPDTHTHTYISCTKRLTTVAHLYDGRFSSEAFNNLVTVYSSLFFHMKLKDLNVKVEH